MAAAASSSAERDGAAPFVEAAATVGGGGGGDGSAMVVCSDVSTGRLFGVLRGGKGRRALVQVAICSWICFFSFVYMLLFTIVFLLVLFASSLSNIYIYLLFSSFRLSSQNFSISGTELSKQRRRASERTGE